MTLDPTRRPNPWMARALWVATAALVLLAAAYLARGARFLIAQPMPSDIHYRVLWMQAAWHRQLPWVFLAAPDPPWALPGNALFFGLAAPACQWAYLFLFAASLALIARWAARVGRSVAGPSGVLMAAAALAVSAICTTLGLGQNAVFVTALLVATLWLDDRSLNWQSGMCLGIALGKPQIAGLFVLPLLARRRFLTIAIAALVNVAGLAGLMALTGASLATLFHAWGEYMHTMGTWPGYGPLQWSVGLGLPQNVAIAVMAGVFGLLATGCAAALRSRSTLQLFALMAVAGRMWTYHQQYDNVMLVFLLIALGERFVSSPGRTAFVAFAICGISLWAPAKACDHTPFQVFQVITWMATAAYLVVAERPLAGAGG